MKIYPNGQSISNRKLVKWGIDPTGNRLHLGHFAAIRFLRKMLAEYRDVVVVIGDLTATIGDPSGTIKERPILSREIVDDNTSRLEEQIKKLLPGARTIRNRNLITSVPLLLSMLGKLTASKLLDRSAFQDRSVRADELIVPVLQAIDSIALGAELEVGGEDQEFNFAITRLLQQEIGQRPEICVMIPIIRGTDGNKMSKSLNNCVWLDASDIHGKIMAIHDDVMDEWIPSLTDIHFADDPAYAHPKARKEALARAIIDQLK